MIYNFLRCLVALSYYWSIANKWLNDGAKRWHDFGHALFGYFLVTFIGWATGIWWIGLIVVGVYCGVKEFLLDEWKGWDNIFDIMHYMIGSGIALLTLLL